MLLDELKGSQRGVQTCDPNALGRGVQGCGKGRLVAGHHGNELCHGCQDTLRPGLEQLGAGILAQQPDGESVAAGCQGIAFPLGSHLLTRQGGNLLIYGGEGGGGSFVVRVEALLALLHPGYLRLEGSKLLCRGIVPLGTGCLAVVQAANLGFGRFHAGAGSCNLSGQFRQTFSAIGGGAQLLTNPLFLGPDGAFGISLDLHGGFQAIAAFLEGQVQLGFFLAQPCSLFGQAVRIAAGIRRGFRCPEVTAALRGQYAQGLELIAGG